jgi:DNA-binding MarR family transcriptional regulator
MQPLLEQTVAAPLPLGLLIAAARRSIKQAATRRLQRRRLSAQQFWLLVAIHEQPGPSLRELAERRHMDSPTASRMMDVLVRRGLVRIEACPEDRRRRSIRLTVRGAALGRQLHPLALRLREAIEEGFSATEAEALRGMLLRVIANVERFERRGASAGALRGTARRKT